MTLNRQKILDLLEQGETETGLPLNYTQIGRIVSLNRESVRQLALALLGETGRQRQAAIKAAWAAQPKPALQAMTRVRWLQAFRRWFAEIEHSYCTYGHHVVPTANMARTSQYRCNACVAAKSRAYYASPKGKAKTLKWQADNPERLKEYIRRYQASAYWKNRAEGRCTKCGSQSAKIQNGKTMVHCEPCRVSHNELHKARYAARKRSDARLLKAEVGTHG